MPSVRRPILCYVTERKSLTPSLRSDASESLLSKIETLAAAGVDWIQIREKDLSSRALAAFTREALRRASRPSVHRTTPPHVLVNDRLDVALSERAAGVHLGESSLPVDQAKRLVTIFQNAQGLPADFLVGASCHSLDSARSAAAHGAGYIFFGPIFATPSKAAYGSPQGLDQLAQVCAALSIPVFAIGGITLNNASSCFAAGASGIAAIRLFQEASDPISLISSIRQQKQ